MGLVMGSALFATVPKTDPLHFRTSEGTDFKKVAAFLKFDQNDLSKISGVSKKSIRFDENIPADLRERLEQISTVCSLVAVYFDGDKHKTYQWFTLPNPMLGGTKPRDMIRLGRYNKLLKFIVEAMQLNEAGPT